MNKNLVPAVLQSGVEPSAEYGNRPSYAHFEVDMFMIWFYNHQKSIYLQYNIQ